MATLPHQFADPFVVRASAPLTASFVAGNVYTFQRKPDGLSVGVTYTRSSGVAGFAEMRVELSRDLSAWYFATVLDSTLTASQPYAAQHAYLRTFQLPAPASDSALLFLIPLNPESGFQHVRLSFREGSGLAAGTLAATLFNTLAFR